MIRCICVLIILTSTLSLGAEDKKSVSFCPKNGKFSVILQGKPLEKTNKVKIGDQDGEIHLFVVSLPNQVQIVTYSDYPPEVIGENRSKFLDGVVHRQLDVLKGKLLSEERITIGKKQHAGREIRVHQSAKQRHFHARIFLVENRLYQVTALGSESFIKSKPVEEYFKSFTISE